MKTISLPYNCSVEDRNFIKNEISKSSNMVRYSFNRFKENLSEKAIRNLSKNLNRIPNDSWLIQCAIKKANYLFKTNKDSKVIFGSKFNFFQRLKKKISKEDFKNNRLLGIYSQGEILRNGNRKFKLDLDSNLVIFKFSPKKHIKLQLPRLRKNYLYELTKLEGLCSNKKALFSVELKLDTISITFDESLIYTSNYQGFNNRVAAIDMNPDSIGFSISEFNGDTQKVLYSELINFSYYMKNLHKSSNSKESKYQNNKQKHELREVAKRIINICKNFKVSQFGIEDLNFKSNNLNSRELNRRTKNKWKRICLYQAIRKQCVLNNIEFKEVNPCYSSFIGNLSYNYPDAIAASLELARRANFKYIKGKFYPSLITKESLFNRWKESIDWMYKSWKELFDIIKMSELKYRHSLEEYSSRVFSKFYSKSKITLYGFK